MVLFALWLLVSILILRSPSLSLSLYLYFDLDFIFVFLIQFSCFSFFRADRNPSGGCDSEMFFNLLWALIKFSFLIFLSISTFKHFATSFLFLCSLFLCVSTGNACARLEVCSKTDRTQRTTESSKCRWVSSAHHWVSSNFEGREWENERERTRERVKLCLWASTQWTRTQCLGCGCCRGCGRGTLERRRARERERLRWVSKTNKNYARRMQTQKRNAQ